MICSKCDKKFDDGKKSTLCPECRSRLGRASKRKGAANELRYAKKLQELFDKYELGYKVRRTPRSGSIHDLEPSDLLFIGLPKSSMFQAHWELKNSGAWEIEKWFAEAKRKEEENQRYRPPILVIRHPNSQQEFMIMDSEFGAKLLLDLEILNQND